MGIVNRKTTAAANPRGDFMSRPDGPWLAMRAHFVPHSLKEQPWILEPNCEEFAADMGAVKRDACHGMVN